MVVDRVRWGGWKDGRKEGRVYVSILAGGIGSDVNPANRRAELSPKAEGTDGAVGRETPEYLAQCWGYMHEGSPPPRCLLTIANESGTNAVNDGAARQGVIL